MAVLSIDSREIPACAGATLFDVAEGAGVRVPSSCRKQGKCRECLVEVIEGMAHLTPRAAEEQHLKDGFRLACRCAFAAEDAVVRAHTLRRGTMRIESGAINLPAREPENVTRRGSGGTEGTGEESVSTSDPALTRRAANDVPHGIAIDLGTTTVVLRAIDLERGAVVATSAFENPQRFGGSDVMARIQYDTDHPGRLLQRTLLGYLSRAIEELPIAPASIREFVVAGNSTMRDLFFGLDVRSIGQKPYWSTTQHEHLTGARVGTQLSVDARALRLPGHPEARVYGMPLVSGHVGADAAAALLALEPHRSDRLVAIMDIGTNTELFLGHRGTLLCASCPAGPAFEGRAISCGMPGLDGAIARVRLADDGSVATQVIGGGRAEGICGSGLVDLLSELLRTGRMNAFGRFEDGSAEFVVDATNAIVFRESDISELAQAKGANVAGLQIVAKHFGCELGDIDTFYLAGGFGRHIDIAAAKRIGLIPDLPDEKIVPVGNAAIEGASIALLDANRRRELEELVPTIRHVELETDPEFFEYFVAGCLFQPIRARQEVGA